MPIPQNNSPKGEKKKKAKFEEFYPSTECSTCNGRGEIKDDYITGMFTTGHWTYKKCSTCNSTGKNIWKCLTCDEMINNSDGMWCSNKNCKMYNIKVVLANKVE